MPSPLLLLYDGRCASCSRWARWVARWDRWQAVEVRDLHDPAALDGSAAIVPKDELGTAVHLILPDGRVLKGFDALRRLLWIHPLLWVFIPAAYLPGMARIGNRLYYRFARRCRFGL